MTRQTTPPEWKIKRLLWNDCRGCEFVGFQEGLRPKDTLVVFNTPTHPQQPTTSMALYLFEFSDPEQAVKKILEKVQAYRKLQRGDQHDSKD